MSRVDAHHEVPPLRIWIRSDADEDFEGNACDADDDNDQVPDESDNCPAVFNADQANNDGDAAGDACDPDDDSDAVADG